MSQNSAGTQNPIKRHLQDFLATGRTPFEANVTAMGISSGRLEIL
jgi:hypothetical protein